MTLRRRLLHAIALLALLPGVCAWADGISDGNRAFRSGNYQVAITRYLGARQQGNKDPAVNFNLGVSYYRLGDYAQAEQWLKRAAQNSQYSTRARYNLGLMYWARGDTRGARSEFKAVEQLADDRQLRSLAHRALTEIYRGADAPAWRRSQSAGIDAGYSVLGSLRLGNDDNVYRSPDGPYVDLSQAGQPLITPVKASGSFAEAEVTAQNVFWSGRHTLMRAAYEFDGRHYKDQQFRNADEYSHRLAVSAKKALGPRQDRTLFMRMYLGHHDEVNFDPDTGVDRVVAGEDISSRFRYWNALTIADYERPIGRVVVGIRGVTELRDYGNVDVVSEYDNGFYLAGASVRFPILPRTQLKMGYDRSLRKYRERQAFDANGTLLAANPALEYWYDTAAVTALFDLGNAALEVGYELSNRDDTFAGYNDYRRRSIRLKGSWRPTRRMRLELDGTSASYDYPNAFAFNVPQGGAKTLDYIEAELRARFSITRHLQLWAEARYWNVDSSDTRYAYSRFQVPVGVVWVQRF
jgi:tetratricopeptide (TPR) repeat protein